MFMISDFSDLAEAFEWIDHSTLTTKRELYGIRGWCLSFFRNIFSDRLQNAGLGDTNSEDLPMSYGIAQGSTVSL